MKFKHAGWSAVLAAAALSAPVLAQTHVQSAAGVGVTSSAGVAVTPGAPTVVVVPGAPNVVPQAHIPGAVMAQADTHTTVEGNTRTTVTRYWANVPPDVRRDASFQRWQSLR